MSDRGQAFRSPEAFRDWLRRNHASASELVVRCYKTARAERGVTYRQALDEALCFGWIDGVRHAVDEASGNAGVPLRGPAGVFGGRAAHPAPPAGGARTRGGAPSEAVTGVA